MINGQFDIVYIILIDTVKVHVV